MIVRKCIAEVERRGLDEVGIYRVSGVASEIQALKECFDTGKKRSYVTGMKSKFTVAVWSTYWPNGFLLYLTLMIKTLRFFLAELFSQKCFGHHPTAVLSYWFVGGEATRLLL